MKTPSLCTNILVHLERPGYTDIIIEIGKKKPTKIVIQDEIPMHAAYSLVRELGITFDKFVMEENGQSRICIKV